MPSDLLTVWSRGPKLNLRVRMGHVYLWYKIDSSIFIFRLLVNMKNMNNMNMDNMDSIVLYFRGIYLLPNEFTGDGNCMFHAVGALDLVIIESSHDSLQVNFMNQIM